MRSSTHRPQTRRRERLLRPPPRILRRCWSTRDPHSSMFHRAHRSFLFIATSTRNVKSRHRSHRAPIIVTSRRSMTSLGSVAMPRASGLTSATPILSCIRHPQSIGSVRPCSTWMVMQHSGVKRTSVRMVWVIGSHSWKQFKQNLGRTNSILYCIVCITSSRHQLLLNTDSPSKQLCII